MGSRDRSVSPGVRPSQPVRMSDDIRPPVLWRRPNAKTYTYNQEFGGSYYQPMINYIDTKNRQGVFFEPPTERIHLPDSAETYMTRGEPRPEEVTGASAKTRMKTLNGVTSRTHLPHGLFVNQQTHYDSVRLLKGDAPGRKQVSYYAGELNCIRNSKMFASRCQADHLTEVLAGNYGWSLQSTGMGGPTADQKFYDPERVKNYTGPIRFKDPERTVPVLA